MTEFERGAHAWGKRVEKRIQQRGVLFQIRGKLKEERAKLRPERPRGFEKLTDEIAALTQPPVVRDSLRRLERELEVRGRRLVPPFENLLVRGAVERVVDLDRRKSLGIVREHLRRGQLLRIEAPFPLGVVVAGCSDPEIHS